MRCSNLGWINEALEVSADHRFQVLRAVVNERLGLKNPGVVDQDIDLAEGLDGGLEQPLGGIRLGNVARHADEARGVAQLLGRFAQTLFSASVADHVVALLQISLCQAQANTARRAGDYYSSWRVHVGYLQKLGFIGCPRALFLKELLGLNSLYFFTFV
ncbi:hypothetical protein PS723_06619 [Pseudomonas fluorescens]|uniref:Uncharacterized protein n=1 Tax=Pseudomonas fluorescens TaxID=294 RepID=A0A5E7G4P5_PSEFL|nr:hypothetical protein PS723_06619 [Pseudomonas fluorescens]